MDAPHAFEPDVAHAAGRLGRRWLKYAPLALVGLALLVALVMGAPKYLSLDLLREQRSMLIAFVARHPYESVAVYIAAYALLVAISVPGALVMTLTGGFLFGVVEGSVAAVVGVSVGAVIMFLIARSALGDVIRARFPRGGRMQRLEAKIRDHAFSCLLTLRLLPVMPLWLVNIAAGFVRIPLTTYASATVLGIIPSTVIYASMGAGLGHVFDRGEALDMSLAFDPQIAAPLAGLLVLSLLPVAVHLYRRRRALPRALG